MNSIEQDAERLAISKYPMIRKLASLFLQGKIAGDTVVDIRFNDESCKTKISNLFKMILDELMNDIRGTVAEMYEKTCARLVYYFSQKLALA